MPPDKKVKNCNDVPEFCKNEHSGSSIETSTSVFSIETSTSVFSIETSTSVFSIETSSNRLSLLPVDVLLHIYQYLSAADFVSLSQLGDPKLTELVDVQRNINFSVCRKTSFELMSSYFSKERVKHIQKLNFNFYIFARPYDLFKIICRCKNLTTLSIIECGIQFTQFLRILKNCSALKDVSWNIKDVSETNVYCHSSVTKLFLIFELPTILVPSAYKILKNFPKLEYAVACFIPDNLIEPPFITTWSESLSFTSSDNLRWFTVIKGSIQDTYGSPHDELACICQELDYPPEVFENADECYNKPPFLQVKTDELNISSFSSCSSSTYSSVIVVMTSTDIDEYEKCFKCISKVAGCKLKYLSIECENCMNGLIQQLPPLDIDQKMNDLFGMLFLDCKNITVLNFGKVHFKFESPLKAMCNLKNLKVLTIPTCAFHESHMNLADSSTKCNQCIKFEDFVSECCKVEDFYLYCCKMVSMQDSEILPIHNWKQLKSFTIYFVTFRACRFLKKIADFCPEFQSFSLIEVAPYASCIYYGDLIYLLRNAKNLSFIRINDQRFNPHFGQLMDALSSAKNLEGICFMTELPTYFNSVSFIKSIKSLHYLHLFHFYSPSVSNCLYNDVKKSMERHGIKNVKVKRVFLEVGQISLQDSISFHSKPFFSCNHIHFKNVMFDSFSYFGKG